jgi:hypothetical protein
VLFYNVFDEESSRISGLVDAIIDVAVDEAMERIASRSFERRSTERRVGYERKKV